MTSMQNGKEIDWSFALSLDIIHSGGMGSKHQLTIFLCPSSDLPSSFPQFNPSRESDIGLKKIICGISTSPFLLIPCAVLLSSLFFPDNCFWQQFQLQLGVALVAEKGVIQVEVMFVGLLTQNFNGRCVQSLRPDCMVAEKGVAQVVVQLFARLCRRFEDTHTSQQVSDLVQAYSFSQEHNARTHMQKTHALSFSPSLSLSFSPSPLHTHAHTISRTAEKDKF